MVAQAVAAAAIGLCCALAQAGALDLQFRATTGTKATDFAESIQSTPSGYHASVTGNLEQSSLELDHALQTLAWAYRVPGEQTELSAGLAGRTIAVHGRFKGKPIDATYDTGGLPWFEYQEISLEKYGTGPSATMQFVTINRSDLKIVRFTVQKKGAGEIVLRGVAIPAMECVLLIDGVPELLLRSRLWLREGDGRYLRLVVPAFAGIGASTIIELVGESGTLDE
jgi:hypothetical protein